MEDITRVENSGVDKMCIMLTNQEAYEAFCDVALRIAKGIVKVNPGTLEVTILSTVRDAVMNNYILNCRDRSTREMYAQTYKDVIKGKEGLDWVYLLPPFVARWYPGLGVID
jgi:hypothetical protein